MTEDEYYTFASYLVGFSIFSGERPGGHFMQFEAWEGREMAVKSTARVIQKYAEAR